MKTLLMTVIALFFSTLFYHDKKETIIFSESLNQKQISEDQQSRKEKVMLTIISKMDEKKELNFSDMLALNDFLLTNMNESFSEALGASLFTYLKGEIKRNIKYLNFLNKKEQTRKGSVLLALINIMYIDIMFENYSYVKFIQDFPIFERNVSVRKEFQRLKKNKC